MKPNPQFYNSSMNFARIFKLAMKYALYALLGIFRIQFGSMHEEGSSSLGLSFSSLSSTCYLLR